MWLKRSGRHVCTPLSIFLLGIFVFFFVVGFSCFTGRLQLFIYLILVLLFSHLPPDLVHACLFLFAGHLADYLIIIVFVSLLVFFVVSRFHELDNLAEYLHIILKLCLLVIETAALGIMSRLLVHLHNLWWTRLATVVDPVLTATRKFFSATGAIKECFAFLDIWAVGVNYEFIDFFRSQNR